MLVPVVFSTYQFAVFEKLSIVKVRQARRPQNRRLIFWVAEYDWLIHQFIQMAQLIHGPAIRVKTRGHGHDNGLQARKEASPECLDDLLAVGELYQYR